MKHRGWIAFSGMLWFGAGIWLLYKGLHYISEGRFEADSMSVWFQDMCGSPSQASSVLMFLSMMIGFVKGRFVLAKTASRMVERIRHLPLPIRISQVYSPSYGILIGAMVALGISFRFLPIPVDLRGFIDVAIGSALMNGSMFYFRAAREIVSFHKS